MDYFLKTAIRLLVLAVSVLIYYPFADAAETVLELATGYDDNVTEAASSATGSGFMLFHAGLSHRMQATPDTSMNFFADGRYYNYFEAGDNQRIQIGIALESRFMQGRLIPQLTADAVFFRDALEPEDDADEAGFSLRMDYMATARLTLGVHHASRWYDFREPVVSARNFGGHNSAGSGGHMGGQGMNSPKNTVSRDDRLQTGGVRSIFYISPFLQTEFSAQYSRLGSSVSTESFHQYQAVNTWIWSPDREWEIFLGAGWNRTDYDHAPGDVDRIDNTLNLEAGISRFFGDFEIYVQTGYTDNNSSLDTEDFRKTVTQCGVTWSF